MSEDLNLKEIEDTNSGEGPILGQETAEEAFENEINATDLEPVYDIPVKVAAVLGRTKMKVNQLLKLNRGAIIELDKKVGETVDIYVNNNLVAKGEVVVVDDRLGVTMSEIVKKN